MIEYPPIDKERVLERIKEMDSSILRLRKFEGLGFEDFEKDEDNYAIASYHLRIILEAIILISTHIISRIPNVKKPRTYTEILLTLGKEGIIQEDFADKLRFVASYRNRLTHDYYEVSPKELFAKIQNNLVDFERFCSEIIEYLNDKG